MLAAQLAAIRKLRQKKIARRGAEPGRADIARRVRAGFLAGAPEPWLCAYQAAYA